MNFHHLLFATSALFLLCAFAYLLQSLDLSIHFTPQAPPPLPSRAFLITTKERHDRNWTDYAVQQIMSHRHLLNISQLEFVLVDDYAGEFGPKEGQCELTIAHMRAHEKVLQEHLGSAWIFEDDVVFHDDFATLFPLYWAEVPNSYEVAYLGQLPAGENNLVACQVSQKDMEDDRHTDPRARYTPYKLLQQRASVFTTHAMAVSAAGAARLSKVIRGNAVIVRKTPDHKPDPTEVKIDLIYLHIHEFYLQPADKLNWVVFDPTVEHLSKYGGLEWCRLAPKEDWPRDCECETCALNDTRVALQLPLLGTGLAYQNACKRQPAYIEVWRNHVLAAVTNGSVNPDPINGRSVPRAPFYYFNGTLG